MYYVYQLIITICFVCCHSPHHLFISVHIYIYIYIYICTGGRYWHVSAGPLYLIVNKFVRTTFSLLYNNHECINNDPPKLKASNTTISLCLLQSKRFTDFGNNYIFIGGITGRSPHGKLILAHSKLIATFLLSASSSFPSIINHYSST